VIAHQELQSIIGQVMDTFRDRIYGLSSASDEMPSSMVMKVCSLSRGLGRTAALTWRDVDVQFKDGRLESSVVPCSGGAYRE
jgi:hypothetical protein